MLGIDSGAVVLEGAHERSGIPNCGADGDFAVPHSRLRHCLHRIDDEIDDHLLDLGAIDEHFRCSRSVVVRNRHRARLKLVTKKLQGLADQFVERDQGLLRCLANCHGANPGDDLGCAPCPGDYTFHRFAYFGEIRFGATEPMQSHFCVHRNGGERLIELMGDRGSQLSQHRHARRVREIRLNVLQHLLGADPFRYVDEPDKVHAGIVALIGAGDSD